MKNHAVSLLFMLMPLAGCIEPSAERATRLQNRVGDFLSGEQTSALKSVQVRTALVQAFKTPNNVLQTLYVGPVRVMLGTQAPHVNGTGQICRRYTLETLPPATVEREAGLICARPGETPTVINDH